MHTKRVSQSRISRKLLALLVPVALVLGAFGAPSVAAAPRLALINDATVSGGSGSLEAQAAVAAGFTVTVVSDAAWALMTPAEFGAYDLLIAGDPTCGSLPPGLVASAPVWGPVVLGLSGGRTQAGNRIIIGTDPVFHQFSGGSVLVTEGIAYAGLQPGRTGMYLDVTCAANYFLQSAETLTLVNAISSPAASGAWTIDADPPCGGSVALIATVPGSFPTLTTATLQGWGCSVHESFPTFKDDFAALAIATDTLTHPTCGVDRDSGLVACGEAYILIAGPGIVVVSGSISLAPLDATNPVGTSHTVTATVTDNNGVPLANQLVTFSVTGVNTGAVGVCAPVTCVSGADGIVTFTYTGTNPGDDTIKASFTDPAGSLQSATAQKHWTRVVTDPAITASPVAITATEGMLFTGTVATFSDPDLAATAAEYSATIDWGDGSPISAGTITGSAGSFTVSGSHLYAEEGGPFAVTVVITDVDNAANTATVVSRATVADAALTSRCAMAPFTGQVFAGPTATFTDASSTGTLSDFSATINWGDASSSAGTIAGGPGLAPYTVSGTHTYSSTGPFTVTTTVTDVGGSTTTATCTNVVVFAFAPGGGAFAIGDTKSAVGTSVLFWGAQWAKNNPVSSGTTVSAFKGFALNPAVPTCGATWSTDPGNSAPPPAGPLPAYMGVIVTSKYSKSGSTISGDILHIVIVRTNPGYEPNPGHAGTGTVVGQVC